MMRLVTVREDEATPGIVFQRVTDGETLGEIAKAWGVPRGRFVEWFTTEHGALYDAALKVRADELAHQCLEIADTTPNVKGAAALAKLQVDTRLELVKKWDRKRYGDDAEGSKVVPVIIQVADLRGATVQLPAAQKSLPTEEESLWH